MTIDSDFVRLLGDGQHDPEKLRDKQIAALWAHARHASRQQLEMTGTMNEIRTMVSELRDVAKEQQKELSENTRITSAVNDTMIAGRVAKNIAKAIGGVVIAVATLWGVYITWPSAASHSGSGVTPGP